MKSSIRELEIQRRGSSRAGLHMQGVVMTNCAMSIVGATAYHLSENCGEIWKAVG